MLELPNVTLFSIDVVNAARIISVIRFSTKWTRFAKMVCLTNMKVHAGIIAQEKRIDWRHIEQSDRKFTPPGMPNLRLPVDYELSILRETPKHFDTSHVLHIEWDSAVLNPDAWDPGWLQYDFIGAPWPDHHDPGWPKCDETNNVGNGGFSLKSKKFCQAVADLSMRTPTDDPAHLLSDSWMCRTMRPKLESMGIKFAPANVAGRFSCENKVYTGQFGFHGKGTATLNGWGGDLGNIRL